MANVTLTIPDNQMQRIGDAFSAKFGFTGKDPNNADETKTQFVKRIVGNHIKDIVQQYESEQAQAAAIVAQGQVTPITVT